jgi:hypothetical protein
MPSAAEGVFLAEIGAENSAENSAEISAEIGIAAARRSP